MWHLSSGYNEILLGIFVLLQVFDFYSTYQVLKNKKCVEANPVMRNLMALFGIAPALAIKTLFTCCIAVYLYYYNVTIALIAIVLIYAVIMYNNWKVMSRG
jgi:ABC-type siderophore export system fused ATPase/permease subunit